MSHILILLVLLVIVLIIILSILTQRRPKNFPPGPNGVPVLGYLPFVKLPAEKGIDEISKKYGGLFGLVVGSHKLVVVSGAETVSEVLKDDRFIGRPHVKFMSDRTWGKPRGIIFSNGPYWKAQRKFIQKNLREWGCGKSIMEDLIKEGVVDLIGAFKKQVETPISLKLCFEASVVNGLWHIMSSERCALDDPKLQSIAKKFTENVRLMDDAFWLSCFNWITNIFPTLTGYNKLISVWQDYLNSFRNVVEEHAANLDVNNPKDLIDSYLTEIQKTSDPDSGFYGDEGIKSLLVVLADCFGGGVETTANSLQWSILYLILNPEVQQKLYEEVIEIIGTDRLPGLNDRKRMNYFQAFIEEVLRRFNVAPVTARATEEDVNFHGYSIPKGTIVIISLWSMNNDPKVWENPEQFRPERFLSPDGTFTKCPHLASFAPGKRSCIGEGLARDQLFLFLTTLVQKFIFSKDPSSQTPSLEPDPWGVERVSKPFKLIISKREK